MSRIALIILFAFVVSSVTVNAASIALNSSDVDTSDETVPLARQAPEESSAEDSEEDDEGDEAEQLQQNFFIEQQKQEEDSPEESDEDAGDDDELDVHDRKRREVEMAAPVTEASTNMQLPTNEQKEPIGDNSQNATEAPSEKPAETPVEVNNAPASVLILIRQALKKVITELPTQQVATNALQYFQLFEHFLQQTIQEVIGDDEDDVTEATTPKASAEGGIEAHSVAPQIPHPSDQPPEANAKPVTEEKKPEPVSSEVEIPNDAPTLNTI